MLSQIHNELDRNNVNMHTILRKENLFARRHSGIQTKNE